MADDLDPALIQSILGGYGDAPKEMELQRQMEIAQQLRGQAMAPQQGRMAGNRYVGPNAITALGQAAMGGLAGYQQGKSDTLSKELGTGRAGRAQDLFNAYMASRNKANATGISAPPAAAAAAPPAIPTAKDPNRELIQLSGYADGGEVEYPEALGAAPEGRARYAQILQQREQTQRRKEGESVPLLDRGKKAADIYRHNKKFGGRVSGPGGPREDRVPINASDGEYVLPVPTVQAMGGPRALDKKVKKTSGRMPGGK